MTTTLTASQAYQEVAREAENIRNGEPRAIDLIDPGDVGRQGDIYITAIDVPFESLANGPWTQGKQLAQGTTQGSRHVAEGDVTLASVNPTEATKVLNRLVPQTKDFEQFFGPVIKANRTWVDAHPEHADITYPPGVYLVNYQRTDPDQVRQARD